MRIRDRQILKLAIKAGELMLHSGAEIYRVEDTIRRICFACGIDNVEVFATPTGIFVSTDAGGEEGSITTSISRIQGSVTDMKKISDLNRFSRKFTSTNLSIEAGISELEDISLQKNYPLALRLLGGFLVATMFCALYSNSFLAALASGGIGILTLILNHILSRNSTNYFLNGFLCCSLATTLAMLFIIAFPGYQPDAIIIGSLMIYVPGAAITNSIRDFLSGDMLAGLARMTEALVIAVSLAIGAGVFLRVFHANRIVLLPVEGNSGPAVSLLVGLIATLGFAILVHVPAKDLAATAVVGGVGWGVFIIAVTYWGMGDVEACFIGTCCLGALSNIFARIFKQASTVFTIPAIMPLVPGSRIFYTMAYLIAGDLTHAAIAGALTIFLVGSIAIGLLVTDSITRIILTVRWKLQQD